ncbi:MAG: hypothetical protein Q8L11_05115 [Candidatus Moranbacteria bacterium]|nr:hypothetical protein [bacterium]MDP1834277.1 hypothetical protein [Candidatus Moranbacteria bacterium]
MEEIFFKGLGGKNKSTASEHAYAPKEGRHLDADGIFGVELAGHKSSLERLDAEFGANIDYAKGGMDTGSQRDAISRVAEKIASSESGSFVGEKALSSAVELINLVKASLSLGEDVEPHEVAGLMARLEAVSRNFEGGKKETQDMAKKEFIDAAALLAEIESCAEFADYQKNDPAAPFDFENAGEKYPHLDVIRARTKVGLRRIAETNRDFVPDGKSFDEFLECLQGIAGLRRSGEDKILRRDSLILKKMRHKPAIFKKLAGRVLVAQSGSE